MITKTARITEVFERLQTDLYDIDYSVFDDGELAWLITQESAVFIVLPPEIVSPELADYLVLNTSDGIDWVLNERPDLLTADHASKALDLKGIQVIRMFPESAYTPEFITEAVSRKPEAYAMFPDSAKSEELTKLLCYKNPEVFAYSPVEHHSPKLFLDVINNEQRTFNRTALRASTDACWEQNSANTIFHHYRSRHGGEDKVDVFKRIPERFHNYGMFKALEGSSLNHLAPKSVLLGVANVKRIVEDPDYPTSFGSPKNWLVRNAGLSVSELTDIVVNPNRDTSSDLQSSVRYGALYYLGALSEAAFAKSVKEDRRLAEIAYELKPHRAPETQPEAPGGEGKQVRHIDDGMSLR